MITNRRLSILIAVVLLVFVAANIFFLWSVIDLSPGGTARQAPSCPSDPATQTPWLEQPTYTPRPTPVAVTCTPDPPTPTPTSTPTATPTCRPTATQAPPEPSPTPYSTSTPYPTLACLVPGTLSPSPTPAVTVTLTATPSPTLSPTPPPGEAKHLAPCAGEGDGSAGNPWCTFAHAAVNTVPGDTVLVHDGAYFIGSGVSTFNNGIEGQPITFRAVNPGQAILLKSGNEGAMLDLRGNSHLRFEGLVVGGDWDANGWTGWRGIHMDNTHDIAFVGPGCALQDLDGRGFYLSGNVHNILIDGCTVDLGWYADGNSHDGLLAYGADISDVHILNSTFRNIDHVGIDLYSCQNCRIEGNEVDTTHSHSVQIGSGEGGKGTPVSVVVWGNRLYGSETFGPSNSQYHNGIYITSSDVQTVTVAFNYIYELDGSGIHIGNPVAGPIDVYNNTIYGANHQGQSTRAGIFAYSTNSPQIDIYNNIVVSTQPEGLTFRVAGGANNNLDADYNLYWSEPGGTTTIYRSATTYPMYADYAASGWEPNSLIGVDPQFIDAANGDFRLQGTSPAIGAGTPPGITIGRYQTE